jgi:branched-chain amino acid transport system substrate-binding protein
MDHRLSRLAILPIASLAVVMSACSSATPATPAATTSAGSQASTSAPTTAPNSSSAAKTPIKIGLSGSFSGATAFYGQESQKGAQLAVDELNASDPKFSYSLVTADDACTPDGGAQAFNNLIDVQNVDVVLGSPCSASTLAGMAVLPKSKTPALTQSSTSPDISKQSGAGGNPYMWRINLDDGLMAQFFAKYIADQGVKNIAILEVNNDYGRGAAAAYKTEFPNNAVKVVDEETYAQGGGDFRSQLSKMSAANPDAMLMIGASQDAAVMVKQFKELGLTFRIFTRGDVVSTTFQEASKDPNLGNGIQEATNWDGSNTVVSDFFNAYKAKYNSNPLSYAGQSYYAVMAIAQAAKLGGPGREGIESGFAKVDWQSPLGRIKFDDHNQAHGDLFVEGFVDGQIKLIQQVKGA